jgi:hypothetical protein
MMTRIAYNANDVTAKDIFSGVQAGKWDMGAAMTMWNERQQMTSPTQMPINRDPAAAALLNGLTREITAPGKLGIPGSYVDASNAEVEFVKYYTEINADPSIKPSQRMELLRKKQLDLLKHYDERKLRQSKTAQEEGYVEKGTIRGEGEQPTTPGSAPEAPLPIPPAAIEYLLAHPETAADFESTFRLPKGAASQYTNPTRGITPEPR